MTDGPFMRTPLTEEQAEDLRKCWQEWLHIRNANGLGPPSAADIYKGALLGRMTMDGKPPHFAAPPRWNARPWWELVEDHGADLADIWVGPVHGEGEDRFLSLFGDRWHVVEEGDGDGVQRYVLNHPRLVGDWVLRRRNENDPRTQKGTTMAEGAAFPIYFNELDWILIGP